MRKQPDPTDTPGDEALAAAFMAARAAESKQAVNLRLFDLRDVSSFTDFFVICSGTNSRQIQSIADEVSRQLRKAGYPALGMEGYDAAEWVLADFGDCIVHIFSEKARGFYDLERLWRQATEVKLPETVPQP